MQSLKLSMRTSNSGKGVLGGIGSFQVLRSKVKVFHDQFQFQFGVCVDGIFEVFKFMSSP